MSSRRCRRYRGCRGSVGGWRVSVGCWRVPLLLRTSGWVYNIKLYIYILCTDWTNDSYLIIPCIYVCSGVWNVYKTIGFFINSLRLYCWYSTSLQVFIDGVKKVDTRSFVLHQFLLSVIITVSMKSRKLGLYLKLDCWFCTLS